MSNEADTRALPTIVPPPSVFDIPPSDLTLSCEPLVKEKWYEGDDDLHKKSCILCSPDSTILTAEEFVEELFKHHAPDLAKSARPTLRKLVSGNGSQRRPRDSSRQVALRAAIEADQSPAVRANKSTS